MMSWRGEELAPPRAVFQETHGLEGSMLSHIVSLEGDE